MSPRIGRGTGNTAGLSLRSSRFLSNRWGPPHTRVFAPQFGIARLARLKFVVDAIMGEGREISGHVDAACLGNDHHPRPPFPTKAGRLEWRRLFAAAVKSTQSLCAGKRGRRPACALVSQGSPLRLVTYRTLSRTSREIRLALSAEAGSFQQFSSAGPLTLRPLHCNVSPPEVRQAIQRWHDAGIKCRFLSHEKATRFDFPLQEYRLIPSDFFYEQCHGRV
jgi:hypothetical protein